jgi:ArsR family transcriptional regulator
MTTLAGVFKALADPSRLRIINLLFFSGELCVCDIEQVMACTQTKVSRHLAYLRNTGLVDTRRKGLWTLYSIATPVNEEQKQILRFLSDLLRADATAQRDARRLSSRIRAGCCTTYVKVKPGGIPATFELNHH